MASGWCLDALGMVFALGMGFDGLALVSRGLGMHWDGFGGFLKVFWDLGKQNAAKLAPSWHQNRTKVDPNFEKRFF